MRRRPAEHEDDELDDLPPIDGALGDDPDMPSELHEIDDASETGADNAGLASLDDTTGEDEAPDLSELEGDETESGWVDESADSPELDLGDSMLVDAGDENVSLEDGDEAPAPDEDFGVGEGGERSTLDAAEEGPIGADEELREGDLPALDADDGDDAKEKNEAREEQEGLLDERVAGEEPVGVPWAAQPWARVGPPLGLAWIGLTRGITALACVSRGALVAGRAESGSFELVRVDLEGARHTLAAEGLEGVRITALAAAGDSVAAVLDDGRLAISRDGGERFEIVALSEGVAAADVALAGSVFWVRTRTGSLLVARTDATGKRTLERCVVPGAVVAIGRDTRREERDPDARAPGDASVIALAVDDAGRPATLVRGREDGTVACEAVQVSGGRPAGVIAARRDHVAYLAASARGGVFIRQPDGQWKRLVWEGRVTALTTVDDTGTLVAATYSEADDSTGLVRVDALGLTSVVARLGAVRDDADADGRAIGVAFDDPRGVLWLAGGFGVAAFAVR